MYYGVYTRRDVKEILGLINRSSPFGWPHWKVPRCGAERLNWGLGVQGAGIWNCRAGAASAMPALYAPSIFASRRRNTSADTGGGNLPQ